MIQSAQNSSSNNSSPKDGQQNETSSSTKGNYIYSQNYNSTQIHASQIITNLPLSHQQNLANSQGRSESEKPDQRKSFQIQQEKGSMESILDHKNRSHKIFLAEQLNSCKEEEVVYIKMRGEEKIQYEEALLEEKACLKIINESQATEQETHLVIKECTQIMTQTLEQFNKNQEAALSVINNAYQRGEEARKRQNQAYKVEEQQRKKANEAQTKKQVAFKQQERSIRMLEQVTEHVRFLNSLIQSTQL